MKHSEKILPLLRFPNHLPDFSSLTTHLAIDPEIVDLYTLFLREERLAAALAENEPGSDGKIKPKLVDKDTIYQAVALARKIAATGYSLQLVSTGEMLDIAQTFCFQDPHAARLMQELVLENRAEFFTTSANRHQELINYLKLLDLGPEPSEAGNILVKLLASLQEKDNSAWTARVAAALAYLSALEN